MRYPFYIFIKLGGINTNKTTNTGSSILSVIRMLRLMENLTIGELADALNIAYYTLQRIEQGSNCFIENYQALADFFSITVDAIIKNDFGAVAEARTVPVEQKFTLQQKMAVIDEERRRIGDKGQEIAYKFEVGRLRAENSKYANLVNPNVANDSKANCDMISFTTDGQVKYIEIKSTKGDPNNPFEISEPEVAKIQECFYAGVIYEILRVGWVDDPAQSCVIVITAEEFLKEYDRKPTEYIASKKQI